MNRNAHASWYIGNHLAFEHPVTRADNGFRRLTNVLLQRQHQALGNASCLNRSAGGLLLVFRRMNAAGEIPQLRHQVRAPWRSVAIMSGSRSEERRVGKGCRSGWAVLLV